MTLETLQKLINKAVERCGKTKKVYVYDKDSESDLDIESVIYDIQAETVLLEVNI